MSEVPLTIKISAPGLTDVINQFNRLNEKLLKMPSEFGRVETRVSDLGKTMYIDGVPTTKKLTISLGSLSDKAREFAGQVQSLVGSTATVRERIDDLGRTTRDIAIETGFTASQWERFRRVAEQTGLTVEQVARVYRMTEGRIATLSLGHRMLAAEVGLAGGALLRLSRTMFWAGLGTMFFFMSLARLNRMMFQVEVAAYGVYRAQRALERAQKDYREAVREFGPTSEEAREAMDRVMDAEIGLEMAHHRVKEAAESQILAWGMLIFGSVPTLLRAVGDSIIAMKELMIAHELGALGALKHATALKFLKYGIVGIAVAAAMYAGYMALTAQATADAESAVRDYERRLGPHSVIGSLELATKKAVEFRKKLEEVGGRRAIGGLGDIGVNYQTVTINIYNPQIRGREDIRELKRQLETLHFYGTRRRGAI